MLTDVLLRQRLGGMLVRYRERTATNRRELGGRVGVTANAIGAYERGERWPDPCTMARLVDVRAVDPVALYEPPPRKRPARNGSRG